MGARIKPEDVARIRAKFAGLLSDMKPDLEFAGESAADAIVQTTLAGLGEDDKPFQPYSPAYDELIQSVGGKPRGNVDMRGIFYHAGQKRYKGKKDLGQGRRANVNVGFAKRHTSDSLTPDLVNFTARTAETRPMRGMTDSLSAMSRDLIKIEATDISLKIIYEPRNASESYMIDHNEGKGKQPKRTWFTWKKAAVQGAVMNAVETLIRARVAWFNDHFADPHHPPGGKSP